MKFIQNKNYDIMVDGGGSFYFGRGESTSTFIPSFTVTSFSDLILQVWKKKDLFMGSFNRRCEEVLWFADNNDAKTQVEQSTQRILTGLMITLVAMIIGSGFLMLVGSRPPTSMNIGIALAAIVYLLTLRFVVRVHNIVK